MQEMKRKLKYGIFIIESLPSINDKDGEILHEILNACRIRNSYHAVDYKDEFINAIVDFEQSKFRYLHLSFHGNIDGFRLNDGKFITNRDFSALIGDKLQERRIFISSCETGNFDLASRLITRNHFFSLIGSPTRIRFDKASLFFPTLYHLMKEANENEMRKDELMRSLKASSDLFQIPINYYSFLRNDAVWNEKEIREYILNPNERTINKKKPVMLT